VTSRRSTWGPGDAREGIQTCTCRIDVTDVVLEALPVQQRTAVGNVVRSQRANGDGTHGGSVIGARFERALFFVSGRSPQGVIDLDVSSSGSPPGDPKADAVVDQSNDRANGNGLEVESPQGLWRTAGAAPGAKVSGVSASAQAIASIPWAAAPDADRQAPPVRRTTNGSRRHGADDAHLDAPAITPAGPAEADVITASELGSGYAMEMTAAGKWLEYAVTVKLGGTFHIDFRLASARQVGGRFALQVDGASVTGAASVPITVPETGDHSTWRRATRNEVSLAAGPHVVRLWFDGNGSAGAIEKFNYFRFVRTDVIPQPMPQPDAPAKLTVEAISPSRIDLSWTDTSNGQAGFKIERALKGETFATIATCPPGTTTYSDTSLAAKTKYYYRVRASHTGGDSVASEQARTTTLAEVPPPPPAEAPPPVEPAPPEPPAPALSPQSLEPSPPAPPVEETVAQMPAVDAGVSAETAEIAPPIEEQPASPGEGNLPREWATVDVGTGAVATGSPGEASFADGWFTVGGAGADIWGRHDAFRFVYRALDGDGQIVARVAALPRADLLAKAGVMVRETLEADSKHAALLVTPAAGARFLRRHEAGGATTGAVRTDNRAVAPPCWLKLVRAGGTITAYRSADGNAWQIVGSDAIELSQMLYVGLAVTSHVVGTANVSVFDQVAVDR
jgi:hypothetical protein